MSEFYTYRQEYGGVVLIRPTGEEFAFLQPGDDANTFLRDAELLESIWTPTPVAGWGPFASCEEHISYLIDGYDMGDSE